MGYLLDRDLRNEVGAEKGNREPGRSREYGLGGGENRNFNREFNVREREVTRRSDYLGVGRRFDYEAMKPFYEGWKNGGVSDSGRYDGLALGKGCGTKDNDGLVPDRLFELDLTDACMGHDSCYADAEKSRFECDWEFSQEIFRSCLDKNYNKYACVGIADTYFYGVRMGGSSAYGGNRKKHD
ncbi:hypothetical protein [Sphingomonas sp. 2SG]|uniref:hypothetical protein n=1 Tax=Sphingomonas sp. 2SG TaxID=2502201 RepID=UPI0010F7C262|nr:hypothetical protein [Sphingomonas sp. 2SG]